MSKASSSLPFVNRPQTHGGVEPYWVPNTDVYVTESGLVIKVELAGMRKEDLELVIEGNQGANQRASAGWLPRAQMQIPGDGD